MQQCRYISFKPNQNCFLWILLAILLIILTTVLHSTIENSYFLFNWQFMMFSWYIQLYKIQHIFSQKEFQKWSGSCLSPRQLYFDCSKVDVWILSKDAKLSKICYVSLWYVNNLFMDLIHTNMICFISLKLFKSLNLRQSMMLTVCKMHKKEELNISGFKKEKKQWLT